MKKNIFVIVIGIIFVLVGSMYFLSGKMQTDELGTLQEEKLGLENKKETLDAANKSIRETVLVELSGSDIKKVRDDESKMNGIFKLANTWSTGKQYMENRAEIIKKYNVNKDSQFLQKYMPLVEAKKDKDDMVYDIDKLKLNSTFVNASFLVLNVDKGNYQYLSEVTINVKNKQGVGKDTKYLATYTINAQGDILDFSGYNLYDDVVTSK